MNSVRVARVRAMPPGTEKAVLDPVVNRNEVAA
jgi:hypothetical protein